MHKTTNTKTFFHAFSYINDCNMTGKLYLRNPLQNRK